MSKYFLDSKRFLNIGLHGATLVARFFFIFFLAKYLDPADVGYYGLFTATIGYSIYFVGLDYYTYVTREILKTPNEQRGRLLKGQAILSVGLYFVFLPIAFLFLYKYAGWPEYLYLWYVPILMLEHFNQEMSRLLVALSQQVTASVILFVRQGSWALIIVGFMIFEPSSRQLHAVMALWASFGIIAALIGVWRLRCLGMGGWRSKLDWAWIRKGVVVSLYFLLATLAVRAIYTFDRYWVEALCSIDIVGAYVLYFGVAGTLLTFLDAGVFAFTYPTLIGLHQSDKNELFDSTVRKMLGLTLLICIGFVFVSWFLMPYLLLWINKPIYSSSIYLYAWLLVAMVINAISMVPHYALYARGYDKPIIYSHIAALICFLLVTWIFSGVYPTLAVPIGLSFSFAVVLAWKTVAYLKFNKIA